MRVAIIRSFAAAFVVAATLVFATPAAAASDVQYEPPVDAPVSDPFRPPTTPYGPGNRGVEYATASGTPVAAAADGTVTFAGVVAMQRWVTLRHADGVRTTYGPLTTIAVHPGDAVRRGDVVGTTAGALMFTARLGEAYVDPASLFAAGPPHVRLVPEPLDLPQRPHFGSDGDALRSALDWEIRHLEEVPGLIVSLTPAPALESAVTALADWRDRPCTASTVAAPGLTARHVAVLVGGLGSSSDNAAVGDVDTTTLGYRSDDVVRFSYRGGADPYDARDSTGDIRASGARLAELLIATAESTGAPLDVIAHSQGGLVVRVALEELELSRPDVLERLGLVVTLATPHLGADLAGIVVGANAQPAGRLTLDAIQSEAALPIAPDDTAVQQLVPGSDLLRDLAAHPPPAGVHFVSIAARGDLVVPAPQAHLDGATNVVVPVAGPTAHDQLPGSPAVTREIALALAGQPPTCETAVDAILDATSGTLIRNAEHLLAAAQGE